MQCKEKARAASFWPLFYPSWNDEKASGWHAGAGGFTVHVSRSSADPQLEGKIELDQAIVLQVKSKRSKTSGSIGSAARSTEDRHSVASRLVYCQGGFRAALSASTLLNDSRLIELARAMLGF
jgi:hypothetical protein